jgi:Na+/H+ antiporter NhaC
MSFIKFSPVFLIAGMVIAGYDILIAAGLAMFYAVLLCKLIMKKSFTGVMEIATEGAKESVFVLFILLTAYAMVEVFMNSGVAAAVIRLFIGFGVTGRTVALMSFLLGCLLSLATGTSWGTYAAVLPPMLWLTDIVGGNVGLTFAACIGGASFGDNFGLMSDTTILSSGIMGVKLSDRLRIQAPYAIICIILASICFYLTSVSMGLGTEVKDASNVLANIPSSSIEVLHEERPAVLTLLAQVESGVPVYMILPIFIVIIMAFNRIDVIICLLSGALSGIVLGVFAGTLTSLEQIFNLLYKGFSDAGSWTIVTIIFVCGFGGIMSRMGAFEFLSVFFVKISKKVRHLLFCNGVFCLLLNMTLCEETAQVATATPIIKQVLEDNVEGNEEDLYKLKIRNAIFSDAMGVMTASLIPWHTGYAYYIMMATALYPLHEFGFADVLLNFYCWISTIIILAGTFTGLDRFIPNFGIPKEPAVCLKKKQKKTV